MVVTKHGGSKSTSPFSQLDKRPISVYFDLAINVLILIVTGFVCYYLATSNVSLDSFPYIKLSPVALVLFVKLYTVLLEQLRDYDITATLAIYAFVASPCLIFASVLQENPARQSALSSLGAGLLGYATGVLMSRRKETK